MHPIDKLLATCSACSSRKRVLVVGDAMIDRWVLGQASACQDHCQKFSESQEVWTPGGAAGAARQFQRWDCAVWLLSPWSSCGILAEELGDFSTELCPHVASDDMPVKTRYLDGGRIVFRSDCEVPRCGMSDAEMEEVRYLALLAVKQMPWDGIVISDYDKGWLTYQMIAEVVLLAEQKQAKVVIDAKREAVFYPRLASWAGCLKANLAWSAKNLVRPAAVITAAGAPPCVLLPGCRNFLLPELNRPVVCRNHVGAGDCFAAGLLLGLMHDLSLDEAATVANHAGRVYVQHRFGRPPWPHEVRKDALPAEGKVLAASDLGRLKASLEGKKVVFINGVFRLPGANHAKALAFARGQGDVLVVGVNDDVSAFRSKRGEYVLPLEERLSILAGMEAVDWIVPFSEDTPAGLCEVLRPDALVKGAEYEGKAIPGSEYAGKVVLCTSGGRHASEVIVDIRGA